MSDENDIPDKCTYSVKCRHLPSILTSSRIKNSQDNNKSGRNRSDPKSIQEANMRQYLGISGGSGSYLCRYFFSSVGCDVFSTFVCTYLSFEDFVNLVLVWSDIAIPFLEQNPQILCAILKTLALQTHPSNIQLAHLLDPKLELIADTRDATEFTHLTNHCKCFLKSSSNDINDYCVFDKSSVYIGIIANHSLCFLMYMWIRYRNNLYIKKTQESTSSNGSIPTTPRWLRYTLNHEMYKDSMNKTSDNMTLCPFILHSWIQMACIFEDQGVLDMIVKYTMNDMPLQDFMLIKNNAKENEANWYISHRPFIACRKSGLHEIKLVGRKSAKQRQHINKLKVIYRTFPRDENFDIFTVKPFNTNQKQEVMNLRNLTPIYANIWDMEKSRHLLSLYIACVLLPHVKNAIASAQSNIHYPAPKNFVSCVMNSYWLECAMKRYYYDRFYIQLKTEHCIPKFALMNLKCPVTFSTIINAIFWEDLDVLEYALGQWSSVLASIQHQCFGHLYLLVCRVATTDTSAHAMLRLLLRYRYPIRSFNFIVDECKPLDPLQIQQPCTRGYPYQHTEELYLICKDYPRYAKFLFQSPSDLFESITKRICLTCPEVSSIIFDTSGQYSNTLKEMIQKILHQLGSDVGARILLHNNSDTTDLRRCMLKRFGIINPSFPKKMDNHHNHELANYKELHAQIFDILHKLND